MVWHAPSSYGNTWELSWENYTKNIYRFALDIDLHTFCVLSQLPTVCIHNSIMEDAKP